jgi:hypothetical protein
MKKHFITLIGLILLGGCAGMQDMTKTEAPPQSTPWYFVSDGAKLKAGDTLYDSDGNDITGGTSTGQVKVDSAATADYLYDGGSGAVRAGTNVTIDDNGDYITVNASLAGGAVDTEGTLNADEIAVMHDADTIKSLTEAEFKTAYNMEAGTDYLAPDGNGGSLTNLDGENIQDDTIDDDSIDWGDVTAADITMTDAGAITSSGAVQGTSLTDGTATVSAGAVSGVTTLAMSGALSNGADPADAGTIRLSNGAVIAFEDATEATITHVDDTGFLINLGLEVDGTLDADGVVALGDGGDNFSVASDGIDIDTSGNITNAGTIGSGAITSSGAITGATVTDGTVTLAGDGTVTGISEGGLPNSIIVSADVKDNDLTASDLAATLTFADGDVIDLSGITHTGATDEGLALPAWANVTPTSDKPWLAYDSSANAIKVYDGGWISIGATAAPTDAQYLTLAVDATLSAERVLTESTQGIDMTDAGAGSTLTVSLDTTEVDATTWSDGANASNVWTFDVSGTDHTMTAGDGLMTFSDAVTVTDTLTANNGIDLGTSNSIVGTTAITIGAGTETVAINSSDWDIDATGVMTGIGNITSDGVVTATGFTIGSAAITEAEFEIIDGATLTTTQLEYLNAATGTTGTTSTNLVFSASPTFTGTVVAAGIDGSGTISANLFTPDAADGADIGSTSLEFSDIYLADGSVIYAGDDQDVTLTHVADTGFDLNESLGIADDKFISFGGNLSGYDWIASYDEATSNRLEFTHTAGADADVYWDLNDNAADSTYTITNSDGTYEANLVVEGDATFGGTITATGSGDSLITLANNASLVGSGYQIFFEGTHLISVENGTEKTLLNATDGATLAGTTWDFGSVTNFRIPNGNSATADAEGEIAIDTDDEQIIMYIGGTAYTWDFTDEGTAGYIPKTDGSGGITWQADATGGSPTWDTVGDPVADVSITMDAGEETSFLYTGNYTTGAQFLVQQLTGNPTGGTLFEIRGADSDSGVFKVGDGTNVWTVSTAGLLTNAGTATLGLAASSDLLIGGNPIDAQDLADVNAGEVTWSSGTVTVNDTGVALTSITIGALLGVDSIDVTGAADIDIGSADVTDIRLITDGDQSVIIGNNADQDEGITFDSDTNDGTINWNEDNATFQFSNVLANTPQSITYNADDDSETVGSDITSSVVLITTDNDSTDETIDIQDGTVSGQMVTFICVSGCDGTDDGVDIDVETDSTCTGCDSSGIYALGTNGDSCTIVWDGTNSAWYEVGYKIQ